MTSCKFGLNLLVPTQQIVYLCDSSVIFTMCRWHIEVVINRVVEYALYSKNCKKSTLNDLIVQIDVCFSGRKLNCNDRNLGKMSSNVQQNFAKDSSLRIYMRIFSLENFAKMNFDSNHWLSLFNKKRIITLLALKPKHLCFTRIAGRCTNRTVYWFGLSIPPILCVPGLNNYQKNCHSLTTKNHKLWPWSVGCFLVWDLHAMNLWRMDYFNAPLLHLMISCMHRSISQWNRLNLS